MNKGLVAALCFVVVALGVIVVLVLTGKPPTCVEASRKLYEKMEAEGKEPFYVIGHVDAPEFRGKDHCVVGEVIDGELVLYDPTGVLDEYGRDAFDIYYSIRGKLRVSGGKILVDPGDVIDIGVE